MSRLRLPAEAGSLFIDRPRGRGTSTVDLRLTRLTPAAIHRFRHDGIQVTAAGLVELQYGKWTDPNEGMPVVTTQNGRTRTQILSNEAQ
jgi:hypothetical protein